MSQANLAPTNTKRDSGDRCYLGLPAAVHAALEGLSRLRSFGGRVRHVSRAQGGKMRLL